MLLYIERWLTTPVQFADGTKEDREKGTPQGGVISPLLANLFLHYAFDVWMGRYKPSIPFERYADDTICHCKSELQAKWLKATIARRFTDCGLKLHPEKTKIVYCEDDDRRGSYPNEKFDFLGFTFRPRRSKNRWGKYFVNFAPAVSNNAAKSMRQTMRGWYLQRRSDRSLDDLAPMINALVQGWINYYGSYYKSALYPVLRHLDRILARWAQRKFRKLRRHRQCAEHWLQRIAKRQPGLFAHWRLLRSMTG